MKRIPIHSSPFDSLRSLRAGPRVEGRSGEALLLVAALLVMVAPEAGNAQVMSAAGCETASTRLADALGIVEAIDTDGAFVVASASGCSVIPVAHGRSVAGPMAHAIDVARGRTPVPDRNRIIVYVNGVAVSPDIQCETLRAIVAATGATVIGVHNATDGLASDLVEVLAQREMIAHRRSDGPLSRFRSGNEAVSTVRRILISSALNGTPAPELWAHSQGAAIISLALYEAGDILKSRGLSIDGVKVTTFAGAAPFWPAGPSYEHYLHTEDAIPRYTGLGRLDWFDETKAGERAKVIRFSGRFAEAAPNAAAPDFSHHDVLGTYLPRYLREHGRPASLIQWSRP